MVDKEAHQRRVPLAVSGIDTNHVHWQRQVPTVVVGTDTNRDGRANLHYVGADQNRDGIPDALQRQVPTAVVGIDTNGDGRANLHYVGADRNRDGIPDALQRQVHLDSPASIAKKTDAEKMSEPWRKFDSELRNWELQSVLSEKASKKDLETCSAALNQSCRDLSASIVEVRQEVTTLGTGFEDIRRELANRSKRDAEWCRREEDIFQTLRNAEAQWRKLDSELRSKTAGILSEKASREDLEKHCVAQNLRCSELSASIFAVRKELDSIRNFGTNFKEMGDAWSKRDRDLEDHMKWSQQKFSMLERQLMQDQKQAENRFMDKFNDLSTEQQTIKAAMLKNTGTESCNEKLCELHQRIELGEDARRNDKREHEGLHKKYTTRLEDIDRSIREINSKVNEKLVGPNFDEAGLRHMMVEIIDEARRGDKLEFARIESVVSDLTENMSYLKSRLEEKPSKTEFQSIASKLEDLNRNCTSKLTEPWHDFESDLRSKTEEQGRKLESDLRSKTEEQWRKLESDLRSKTEEQWRKLESDLRSKTEEQRRKFNSELSSKTEDQLHKWDAELRSKTLELQRTLSEKASITDLEKYSVALNQSCRDLSSSIINIRQEVTSLGINFNEMGESWSKRDRELANLSKIWSKRDSEWLKREEDMLLMTRQWSEMWASGGRQVATTFSPRWPHHTGSSSERVGGESPKSKKHLRSDKKFSSSWVASHPQFSQGSSRKFDDEAEKEVDTAERKVRFGHTM